MKYAVAIVHQRFVLHSIAVTGTIPSELGLLSSLSGVFLDENSLTVSLLGSQATLYHY